MPRLNAKDAVRRQAAGRGSDHVEALARGLAVIRAFARDNASMTLSDAARLTQLAKPTVRRVLHTLVDLGYAETDGRAFQLTPAVLSLAAAYLGSDQVSAVLQPACERIRQATGEACFVAVLDRQEIVMIAHASPRVPIGLISSVGTRMPAFATAAGRVLLGLLSDEELDARLNAARLKGSTKYTLTDKAKLRASILRGRADGYCITKQEAAIGYCAVAVPLRRANGRAIGAISIPALTDRGASKPGIMNSFLKVLRAEVETLSQQLI
jgi:IclR family transcriptional regulator, pca regulon regulatory protein